MDGLKLKAKQEKTEASWAGRRVPLGHPSLYIRRCPGPALCTARATPANGTRRGDNAESSHDKKHNLAFTLTSTTTVAMKARNKSSILQNRSRYFRTHSCHPCVISAPFSDLFSQGCQNPHIELHHVIPDSFLSPQANIADIITFPQRHPIPPAASHSLETTRSRPS